MRFVCSLVLPVSLVVDLLWQFIDIDIQALAKKA